MAAMTALLTRLYRGSGVLGEPIPIYRFLAYHLSPSPQGLAGSVYSDSNTHKWEAS